MLTEIILLVAALGLGLLIYLWLAGRGEEAAWLERVRGHVRRESARARAVRHVEQPAPGEALERRRIEAAWEQDRARAALQEADADEPR